jgi:hypothetical protein
VQTGAVMKEFPDKAYSPGVIDVATSALHATVNSLPEPPSPAYVNLLARLILRIAMTGEHDVAVLRTVALLECSQRNEPK